MDIICKPHHHWTSHNVASALSSRLPRRDVLLPLAFAESVCPRSLRPKHNLSFAVAGSCFPFGGRQRGLFFVPEVLSFVYRKKRKKKKKTLQTDRYAPY